MLLSATPRMRRIGSSYNVNGVIQFKDLMLDIFNLEPCCFLLAASSFLTVSVMESFPSNKKAVSFKSLYCDDDNYNYSDDDVINCYK